MCILDFKITGAIVAKARPRACFKSHCFYTPKKTVDYENTVKKQAIAAMEGKCVFMKPIALTVELVFCIQAPRKYINKRGLKQDVHPIAKPDIDNLIKIILDGMNKIVYEDDSQVIEVKALKKYVVSESAVSVKVRKF